MTLWRNCPHCDGKEALEIALPQQIGPIDGLAYVCRNCGYVALQARNLDTLLLQKSHHADNLRNPRDIPHDVSLLHIPDDSRTRLDEVLAEHTTMSPEERGGAAESLPARVLTCASRAKAQALARALLAIGAVARVSPSVD